MVQQPAHAATALNLDKPSIAWPVCCGDGSWKSRRLSASFLPPLTQTTCSREARGSSGSVNRAPVGDQRGNQHPGQVTRPQTDQHLQGLLTPLWRSSPAVHAASRSPAKRHHRKTSRGPRGEVRCGPFRLRIRAELVGTVLFNCWCPFWPQARPSSNGRTSADRHRRSCCRSCCR